MLALQTRSNNTTIKQTTTQQLRRKGRDLTQSYDKSPYNNRNVKKAKRPHKQRYKPIRLHSGCGPT